MTEPTKLIVDTIELVKASYKIAKQQENQEFADSLMQVRENLQEIREAFSAANEGRGTIEARIKELEDALELRPALVRHMGVYWKKSDPDPWCPTCWEGEQRAVHMNPTAVLAGRLCVCQRCNFDINLDNTRPPSKWPKQ